MRYNEYVNMLYTIVAKETKGLDAVYEDFIFHLVGIHGLLELQKNKLIETCGVVNGRQLYTLCEKQKGELIEG